MFYFARIIEIAVSLFLIYFCGKGIVDANNNEMISEGMQAFKNIAYGIFIIVVFVICVISIKKLLRHRKIIKKGYATYGVVIGRKKNYYLPLEFDYMYTVKVIMEDKSVRLFSSVRLDNLDLQGFPDFEPGMIVTVKYYDNEIVMKRIKEVVAIPREDLERINKIRKAHGFVSERLW